MAQLPATRRFTVDEYEAMGRAGILAEDDRVELIDGEVVEMPPIGSRHAGCVNTLTEILAIQAHGRAVVAVQNPAVLSEYSAPQPDFALLRYRDDRYRGAHPRPEDILLLIEVSDTTLAYDRGVKVPLYARAAVAEVWIVDLEGDAVEVYREPEAGEYRVREVRRRGEQLRIEVLDAALSVDTVLG